MRPVHGSVQIVWGGAYQRQSEIEVIGGFVQDKVGSFRNLRGSERVAIGDLSMSDIVPAP